MHLYIVSGILLIVPIVDFALAAPVLVQEKRQARADMTDISAYPITVLGKRGEIEEVGGKYIENWFVPAKESSVAHGSSSSAPSEPGHVSTSVMNAPAPNPGPSTEFYSDHRTMAEQPPSQTKGASTEPDYEMVDSPPSSTMSSTEPDYEMVDFPPSGTVSSTDPNRESMSAVSPLENLQTDSDALKGQAKVSRRNSGTARDVGNAA
jgi:hypothetical protein